MNKQHPVVSIIISVFGQLEYTKRCLDQLEKTLLGKISYEVLIVDDGSTDGTKEFLLTLPFPYRVFFNEKNKGYAKNNNYAAREAKGEFICFLNNDVFVQGNWLLPMIEVFQTKKMVGMVGNVQRLANSIKYDHMGVVFAPQANPRHYGQGFLYRPFKGKVKKWSAVTAACCVITLELFEAVGGFDEDYLNGCEDVDLCLKISERGKVNYVVHDSVVFHVKGASDGRKNFNDRNAQILLDRWKTSIVSNQSIEDQYKHAWTYICRAFLKPYSVNLGKLIEAIQILFRLKKLE